MDGDDGYKTMWTYSMPLNWTVKNSENGTFYIMSSLPEVKKKGTNTNENNEKKQILNKK